MLGSVVVEEVGTGAIVVVGATADDAELAGFTPGIFASVEVVTGTVAIDA
jgi:hypothetical protein